MFDEGDDPFPIKRTEQGGLQEPSAILKYYEGDHELLRAILGTETFDVSVLP